MLVHLKLLLNFHNLRLIFYLSHSIRSASVLLISSSFFHHYNLKCDAINLSFTESEINNFCVGLSLPFLSFFCFNLSYPFTLTIIISSFSSMVVISLLACLFCLISVCNLFISSSVVSFWCVVSSLFHSLFYHLKFYVLNCSIYVS